MIRCYGHRMLNPFHGIVNVVEIPGADAVSRDGVDWALYLQGGTEREFDDQGNAFDVELPDIKFGTWSAADGLRRAPVRSVVDYQWLDSLGGQLLEAVKRNADRVPFPLQDCYELWLLDDDGLPLALLDSCCEPPSEPLPENPKWSPGQRAHAEFLLPETGFTNPSHRLAELVNAAAGKVPRARWFLRDSQGCGQEWIEQSSSGRRLEAERFPRLLLRQTWSNPEQRLLVRAFVEWQAPWLLCLQGLGTGTRRNLEQAGCRQAVRLARLYRLYPRIEDRHRFRAALVEAELRRAAAKDEGRQHAADLNFFVSGN